MTFPIRETCSSQLNQLGSPRPSFPNLRMLNPTVTPRKLAQVAPQDNDTQTNNSTIDKDIHFRTICSAQTRRKIRTQKKDRFPVDFFLEGTHSGTPGAATLTDRAMSSGLPSIQEGDTLDLLQYEQLLPSRGMELHSFRMEEQQLSSNAVSTQMLGSSTANQRCLSKFNLKKEQREFEETLPEQLQKHPAFVESTIDSLILKLNSAPSCQSSGNLQFKSKNNNTPSNNDNKLNSRFSTRSVAASAASSNSVYNQTIVLIAPHHHHQDISQNSNKSKKVLQPTNTQVTSPLPFSTSLPQIHEPKQPKSARTYQQIHQQVIKQTTSATSTTSNINKQAQSIAKIASMSPAAHLATPAAAAGGVQTNRKQTETVGTSGYKKPISQSNQGKLNQPIQIATKSVGSVGSLQQHYQQQQNQSVQSRGKISPEPYFFFPQIKKPTITSTITKQVSQHSSKSVMTLSESRGTSPLQSANPASASAAARIFSSSPMNHRLISSAESSSINSQEGASPKLIAQLNRVKADVIRRGEYSNVEFKEYLNDMSDNMSSGQATSPTLAESGFDSSRNTISNVCQGTSSIPSLPMVDSDPYLLSDIYNDSSNNNNNNTSSQRVNTPATLNSNKGQQSSQSQQQQRIRSPLKLPTALQTQQLQQQQQQQQQPCVSANELWSLSNQGNELNTFSPEQKEFPAQSFKCGLSATLFESKQQQQQQQQQHHQQQEENMMTANFNSHSFEYSGSPIVSSRNTISPSTSANIGMTTPSKVPPKLALNYKESEKFKPFLIRNINSSSGKTRTLPQMIESAKNLDSAEKIRQIDSGCFEQHLSQSVVVLMGPNQYCNDVQSEEVMNSFEFSFCQK